MLLFSRGWIRHRTGLFHQVAFPVTLRVSDADTQRYCFPLPVDVAVAGTHGITDPQCLPDAVDVRVRKRDPLPLDDVDALSVAVAHALPKWISHRLAEHNSDSLGDAHTDTGAHRLPKPVAVAISVRVGSAQRHAGRDADAGG